MPKIYNGEGKHPETTPDMGTRARDFIKQTGRVIERERESGREKKVRE